MSAVPAAFSSVSKSETTRMAKSARAAVMALTRSGMELRASEMNHGSALGRYDQRMVSGPSGSKSQPGIFISMCG